MLAAPEQAQAARVVLGMPAVVPAVVAHSAGSDLDFVLGWVSVLRHQLVVFGVWFSEYAA